MDFRPERADFRPERAWGRDGWTNEQKSPCVSQYFVLFGAAALLPRIQFTIMQSRVTGIAVHILPLGDLFFIILDASEKI